MRVIEECWIVDSVMVIFNLFVYSVIVFFWVGSNNFSCPCACGKFATNEETNARALTGRRSVGSRDLIVLSC